MERVGANSNFVFFPAMRAVNKFGPLQTAIKQRWNGGEKLKTIGNIGLGAIKLVALTFAGIVDICTLVVRGPMQLIRGAMEESNYRSAAFKEGGQFWQTSRSTDVSWSSHRRSASGAAISAGEDGDLGVVFKTPFDEVEVY